MTDKNYSKPVPYTENVERSGVSLGEGEPFPLIKGDEKQLTSNLFLYVDCVQEREAGCLFTISLPGKAI